jgi:hypothetical protein
MATEGTPVERREALVETSPPVADPPVEESSAVVDSDPSRGEYADWLATAVEAEDVAGDVDGALPPAEGLRTSDDLYAFGGRVDDGYPREPRPKDFGVESPDDRVGPYRPEAPRDVVPGASAFTSVEAGQALDLKGQVFHLPVGSELSSGMGLHADGQDVGGREPEGHRTLYPAEEMSFSDMQEHWRDLPWEWHGTVNKRGIFNPAEGR